MWEATDVMSLSAILLEEAYGRGGAPHEDGMRPCSHLHFL